MGKGNRNRQQNLQQAAEDRYNHPEKYQKKGKGAKKSTGLPAWASVLAIVLVAVIMLGSVSLIVIYENGIIFRSQKAIQSEHYEINGTMMQYYYYYQFQQEYTTYYNMAVQYMGSADYISYFGWNLNANYPHDDELNNACKKGTVKKDKDGKDMKDEDGNVIYDSEAIVLRNGTVFTWWDYFMDLALEQAREVLVFCEAAYDAGYTTLESLNPEAVTEIDDAIAELKKTASEAGYTVGGYLSQMYGNGVTIRDVRNALELASIASEYTLLIEEKFGDEITSDDVNKEYDKNKYNYHYSDTLSIAVELHYDDILEGYVEALKDEYTDDEYNEAVKKADKEYTTRLTHLRAIAPKFADAQNNESIFRALVQEIYCYEFYFALYDDVSNTDIAVEDAVKDALDFLKTMTDDTNVKDSAATPFHQKIAAKVYEQMDLLLYEDMTYEDDTLGNWAFKTLEQKIGNVLVTITEIDGKENNAFYPVLEYVDVEEKEEESDDDHDHEDEETEEEDSKKEEDDDKKDNKIESEYEGEEYTFAAYYMMKPGAREEYSSLDIGFIVTGVDNHEHEEGEEVDHEHVDAEAVSKEYLADLLKKGELTPEIFEEYAKEKGLESYDVVESYLKGDFGYDEMDEWAFGEESRVGTGDVIAIYGENDDPLYYVTVYCFGEGDQAWYIEVKEDILHNRYESWDADMREQYGKEISTNSGLVTKVGK